MCPGPSPGVRNFCVLFVIDIFNFIMCPDKEFRTKKTVMCFRLTYKTNLLASVYCGSLRHSMFVTDYKSHFCNSHNILRFKRYFSVIIF